MAVTHFGDPAAGLHVFSDDVAKGAPVSVLNVQNNGSGPYHVTFRVYNDEATQAARADDPNAPLVWDAVPPLLVHVGDLVAVEVPPFQLVKGRAEGLDIIVAGG